MHFEMEPPAQPIGQGNVGDRAYEEVVRYLHLSRDIGGSGRRNEEKAMLEKLITVDPNQPSAYNNLYVSCSELAVMAERYRPEEYEQLAIMAIHYLYRAILNTVSETLPDGRRKAPDSPRVEMLQALVYTINHNALSFIEACMRDQRGKVNARLENIERCFQAMVVLFDQCNESTAYKVHGHFGFCLQKLMKVRRALSWCIMICVRVSCLLFTDDFCPSTTMLFDGLHRAMIMQTTTSFGSIRLSCKFHSACHPWLCTAMIRALPREPK